MPKNRQINGETFYVSKTDEVYFSCSINGLIKIDSLGRVDNLYKKKGPIIIKKDSALILKHLRPYDNIDENNFKFTIIDKNNKNHNTFTIKETKKLSRYSHSDGYIMIIKGNNNYFYSNGQLLFQFNENGSYNYRILPSNIGRLNIDYEGNLWVTTLSGVYFFEKANINIAPKHTILKERITFSVFQDREGGYWFPTLFNGIYYLPNLHTKVITKKNGLSENSINCLAYDTSGLWMGYSKNSIVNIKNKKDFKSFTIDKKGIFIEKLYYSKYDNKLWILNTFGVYYFQKNILKKESPLIKYKSESIVSSVKVIVPKDILQTDNGTYWLVSRHGLRYYNGSWNKINEFNPRSRPNALSVLSDSTLLIGCDNGLWKYNINKKSQIHLGETNKLLQSKIRCIEYNKYDSTYWIGTANEGLVLYNNDTVRNINKYTGLLSNNIKAIKVNKNNAWLATNKGVNQLTFDNNGVEIRTYTVNQSIPSSEINDVLIKDSLLYVATKKGLGIIDYKNLKINSVPPKIHINKISILQKDTLLKEEYILPYNKNSISVSYVGLMYKNILDKRYKY